VQKILHKSRQWTDERFARLLKDLVWEAEISHYALRSFQGGKAVRPALLYLVNGATDSTEFSHPSEAVLDLAVALEMIHAYSLVHDDLPAMDDDDFRRGQPTTHRLVGEGLAVLVGDALLTGAFEVLSRAKLPDAVKISCIKDLAEASGGAGMVGGQWMDLRQASSLSQESREKLHQKKTGALFGAAVSMGLRARAQFPTSESQIKVAKNWGIQLGYLFQLVDDLLDSEIAPAETKTAESLAREVQNSLQETSVEWQAGPWVKDVLDFFTQRKT